MDEKEVGKIEDLLSDVTNLQFMQIASIVYQVNFEDVAQEKNVKSLLEKVKNLFQLRRPSLSSVSDTGTDLNTSIKEDLGKEELPPDN